MLQDEFHHFAKATGFKEMQERIPDIERISALWAQIADKPFDEDAKTSKLKAIVPSETYKYIAQEARKCTG
mgnify:CR=1 FL=1